MLFKNLSLVTSDGIKKCDILVKNGKIAGIGKFSGNGIDFKGRTAIPSVIDMHVHCRDFEQSYKETVETATKAAISKGITGIVDMPNTVPPVDTREVFEERKKLFKEKSYCDYGINFSVTKDLKFFDGYKFIKIFLTETTGKLLFKGDLDRLFSYRKPIAIHSDSRYEKVREIINEIWEFMTSFALFTSFLKSSRALSILLNVDTLGSTLLASIFAI